MRIINSKELRDSIQSEEDGSIFLDPILDDSQIGNITVDLRLGYDFLVSIVTRKPYIELSPANPRATRGISSYFQETRRELGDRFVLYPDQVVLTTSLEYLSMPENIYADILSRSSYTRLGIHINTMVQPGFKGCIPLELYNHGNNAIELVVGSRICQARFFDTDSNNGYLGSEKVRKYYGDVRPKPSRADIDKDLIILSSAKESIE